MIREFIPCTFLTFFRFASPHKQVVVSFRADFMATNYARFMPGGYPAQETENLTIQNLINDQVFSYFSWIAIQEQWLNDFINFNYLNLLSTISNPPSRQFK
ncbi:hypothetical protein [Methylovulum sp.]|uniref:hypothetical protein n=1 Tax=Methylovulum sp. TaxID=1916980 RepID=UPI0026303609|nr:hypothetical protein [Methylovulum sp.]